MTALDDVQARIAAIGERVKYRSEDHRSKPPGVRVLPPLPDHPSPHEIARRQQCEALLMVRRHGRRVQCPARGHDMLDGHALCWVHRQIVVDRVASLLDVLAGTR